MIAEVKRIAERSMRKVNSEVLFTTISKSNQEFSYLSRNQFKC